MGKIGDKRRANKPNECDGYCGLYVSLPFWLIAMFFALKPMFQTSDPWGGLPNPYKRPANIQKDQQR